MQTNEFLLWIAARLVRLEGISENTDYILKLRELAASHLQPEAWTKVEDGLPPMEAGLSWKGKFQCSSNYMTYNGFEFQSGKLYINDKDGSKTWTTTHTEYEIQDVTHWRELPAAPGSERKVKA